MVNGGFIQNSKFFIQNSGFRCRRGRRRSDGGEEGDAVDFSEPGGWVAAGGVEHSDFMAFGEARVDPIFYGAVFYH